MTKHRDVLESPESALERNLIAQYLRDKGYQLSDLEDLPEQESNRIMKEACQYATSRLAEIEARSKFRHNIEAPKKSG